MRLLNRWKSKRYFSCYCVFRSRAFTLSEPNANRLITFETMCELKKYKLFPILCLCLMFAGCSAQGGVGGIFGRVLTTASSAAGAYGGSRIGHGATPYILGPIGATVGAWIGSSIAGFLNDGSQQLMAGATLQAAQTGQTQVWNEPSSGTSGRAEIVQTPPSTSTYPAPQNNRQPCRVIEQSVTMQNGDRHIDQVTACPGTNGWQIK